MGREARRVPPDWQHPIGSPATHGDGSVRYRALHDGADYARRKAAWEVAFSEYGLRGAIEREGNPPDASDYMPQWSPDEATHLMMYETCSEGTPISPAFATAEELARWLADNGASAFGDMTASYEGWLGTIKAGGAVGAMFSPGTGFVPGVELNRDKAED